MNTLVTEPISTIVAVPSGSAGAPASGGWATITRFPPVTTATRQAEEGGGR